MSWKSYDIVNDIIQKRQQRNTQLVLFDCTSKIILCGRRCARVFLYVWFSQECPVSEWRKAVEESENCRGRNFCRRRISYFSSKTLRTEFNFVLSNWPKKVEWIPFLMFLVLFEKIKSPACLILFKFSGELCYGLIYSPLLNEILSAKNNGFFEHPALFATLLRSVHKGREDPAKDCC